MLVNLLEKLPILILALLIILLPSFTLPWTTDQIELNKQMLLYATVPVLGLFLLFRALTQKTKFRLTLPDIAVISFGLIYSTVSFFAGGNLWDNLVTETFPLLSILALYLLVRQVDNSIQNKIIVLLSFSLSIALIIVITLGPLLLNAPTLSPIPRQINTPSQIWYPTGSLFNSLWFVIVSIPLGLGLTLAALKNQDPKISVTILKMVAPILLIIMIISGVILARPLLGTPSNAASPPIVFLDHQTGWKVLLGTLTFSPISGIGPGNYVDAFTRFKPVEFNKSPLWNFRATASSNLPFYLGTTSGLIGLLAYIILIVFCLKMILKLLSNDSPLEKSLGISLLIIILLQLFFPAPFLLLVIFFILTALATNLTTSFPKKLIDPTPAVTPSSPSKEEESIPNSYLLLLNSFLTLATLTLFSFIMAYPYQAEVNAQKAAVSILSGNGREAVKDLDEALRLSPYRESYYPTACQINLALGGDIIAKTASPGAKLSQADTQLLEGYIKKSLSQAKKPTELSPNRSGNWENLAKIYRRIAGLAENPLPWIVKSYEKAIETDPTNPRLLVDLGGVYFGVSEYASASAFFKKAVDLKPDYNNARYNLAHTFFQLGNYEDAVTEMEKALALTNKQVADYNRAKSELELFRIEMAKKKTLPPTVAGASIGQPEIIQPSPTLIPPQVTIVPKPRKVLVEDGILKVASDSALPATPQGQTFPPVP
jgi:tetratricopeptide (TPR) repeat protein